MIKSIKNFVKSFLLDLSYTPMSDFLRFKKSLINHVSFWQYLNFKLKRNKKIYWPVHDNSEVTHPDNIFVGYNSNPGTRPGCYIQGNGGIYIGNYVQFGSNISIISGNHDVYNQRKHINKKVFINDYCWVGQGAIILPGVSLGKRTIVGAGSVVTKSFPEGFCVIAGNPAKKIRDLEESKFVIPKSEYEFYGFIPRKKFFVFAKKSRNTSFKVI